MMAASKEDEAAMPRLAPLAQEQRLRHLVEPFLLAISMSVYGCRFNRSMQHMRQIALPVFHSLKFSSAVR